MAKMNIYVSDRLKERMDEIEGENWSRLASVAFESRLAEIITKQGVKDMKDVAMRLRASKNDSDSKARNRGREAGTTWAKEDAELENLEALERWVNSSDGNYTDGLESRLTINEGAAFGANHRLVEAIKGNGNLDRSVVNSFWTDTVGVTQANGDHQNPAFLTGFVEGAMSVWDAVKDDL